MKKIAYTTITLLLILSSLSIVGVTLINHDVHQRCPFAVISSENCEMATNTTVSTIHHIIELKAFTEALLTSSANVLFALLFALSLIFFNYKLARYNNFNNICFRLSIQNKLNIPIPNNILKWLVLHNKIDSHLHLVRVVI